MSAVLFDVPGPRAIARNRLSAVLGTVVILGLVAYVGYRFYDTGQFEGRVWSWLQYERIQTDLVKALLATLQAFAVGAVLALAFGAVFAAGRLSEHAWLRVPSMAIVEFFRAIPLLILIFLFYYGLPAAGVKMTPFMALVLGLMLYNGSVLAEIFRAGILSLPRGQSEAAYALGMRKTQVMTLVLLPQAVRAMLPAIVSQLVVLLKDTALGFLITYYELLKYTQNIGGSPQFGRPFIPVLIVVSAIYITLCLLLSWLATYLESRNRRSRKVQGGTTAEIAPEQPPLVPPGSGSI
ncbi:MAG TPA: amino acid ABC transporter permease [Pseudonocardiaceae bacterium]